MHNAGSRTVGGAGLLAAVALLATLTACSSSGSKSSGSSAAAKSSSSVASTAPAKTSSSAPATTDYSKLLISASDIPVPGFTEGTPAAPPQGQGTTVAFTSAAGRTVGDTIIVFASAAQATSAASASTTAAKQQITSPEVSTVPLGDGGTALRGTASGKEVAVLIWRQGRAVVVLEFESKAGDPVPTSVIQTTATKQQDKVKAGIPA